MIAALLLGAVHWGGTQPAGRGANLDPTTARAMQELERLVLVGSSSREIEQQLERIINSSGYISALAPIFYRLANSESDARQVVGYYITVIERWSRSSWAQKSLIELVPLVEMSEGDLGREFEQRIWNRQEQLLTLADDAPQIGEDPELLRAEVLQQLIYLAHLYGESHRIDALMRHSAMTEEIGSRARLAFASTAMLSGPSNQVAQTIQTWLRDNPGSILRPFAMLLLFESTGEAVIRDQAIRMMADNHVESLEARLLLDRASSN